MNFVYLLLLSLAFIGVECFAGGTRLIYSLPAYTLIGVAAMATVFSVVKPVKIRPNVLCLASTALFIGYILVRSRLSPVVYLARDDFMMGLACLAIYLITSLYFVKSRFRMLLIALLLALALGQVVVGLVQFTRGNDFELFGYHRFPNGNRASGQYISPNHLAGYLEVVGILGMSLVFWSTWKPWAKILGGYVSIVALGGVLITGSRGGYVSTAVCILVFCALSISVIKIAYPERLTRVILIGGAALLLVAGAAVPFVVNSSLVKTRSQEIFQKDMRLSLWAAAWQQVQLEPITGTGSGTYLYYGRKFRDPAVVNDPVRVHNDYLDLLAEYGAVGVVLFLLFLGMHLKNGFHTFFWLVRKRLQFTADWISSSLALDIGCLCSVAAYIVHSVVDFNLHIPANAMLMAFVFGMLANPGLETAHEKKISVRASWAFQFGLAALGAALVLAAVPKIPGEYYTEKARVALRDGQYLDSTVAAKTGLEWEKQNPDLYYYLGEAQRNVGDIFPTAGLRQPFYQAASDAFKKGLELFPEDERLLLIEGWTLDALGQYQEGGKYFHEAMEWDPNSRQVLESNESHKELIENAQTPPASQ